MTLIKFQCTQVYYDGKRCQQGSQIIDLDVDATDMYGPETITMRGLQSETFAYYVHIYTNDVCWNKISANVKIYQASTGGLLHSIQQPDCSESKSFFFVSQRDSLKLPGGLLLGILGGGVPPDSPNPNPIEDQNLSFFTPVFKPGL